MKIQLHTSKNDLLMPFYDTLVQVKKFLPVFFDRPETIHFDLNV